MTRSFPKSKPSPDVAAQVSCERDPAARARVARHMLELAGRWRREAVGAVCPRYRQGLRDHARAYVAGARQWLASLPATLPDGRTAYAVDVAWLPLHHDGTERPSWAGLPGDAVRRTWERNPTARITGQDLRQAMGRGRAAASPCWASGQLWDGSHTPPPSDTVDAAMRRAFPDAR